MGRGEVEWGGDGAGGRARGGSNGTGAGRHFLPHRADGRGPSGAERDRGGGRAPGHRARGGAAVERALRVRLLPAHGGRRGRRGGGAAHVGHDGRRGGAPAAARRRAAPRAQPPPAPALARQPRRRRRLLRLPARRRARRRAPRRHAGVGDRRHAGVPRGAALAAAPTRLPVAPRRRLRLRRLLPGGDPRRLALPAPAAGGGARRARALRAPARPRVRAHLRGVRLRAPPLLFNFVGVSDLALEVCVYEPLPSASAS